LGEEEETCAIDAGAALMYIRTYKRTSVYVYIYMYICISYRMGSSALNGVVGAALSVAQSHGCQ